jgi:hypothetical protein
VAASIKGSELFAWLAAADRLPGKALSVGVQLWFLANFRVAAPLAVSLRQLPFGLDKQTGLRAVRQLEQARLIRVKREPGRPLVITIRKAGGRGRKRGRTPFPA